MIARCDYNLGLYAALRALSNVVGNQKLTGTVEVWYHQKAFTPAKTCTTEKSQSTHTVGGRLTEGRGGPQQHT